MNLVEYQTKLEHMVETQNFDQRPKLENLATRSPEHQRVWEDFLIVEHALSTWKQDLPEVDLVEAVMLQLDDSPASRPGQPHALDVSSTQSVRRRSADRWIYASILSVAALLLAVSLKFSVAPSEQVPPNTIAAKTDVSPTHPLPLKNNDNSNNKFNQLLRNAGAASWGLAQSTAGAMTEAVNLVPVTRPVPATADTLPEKSNWVDDINHEMQPIKEQIGHAWNFIIHSVPEESTRI